MGIIQIIKQNATHLREKHQLVKNTGLLKILGVCYLIFLFLFIVTLSIQVIQRPFSFQTLSSLLEVWLGITFVFLVILGIIYFFFPFQKKAFLHTDWVNRQYDDQKHSTRNK